MADQHSQNIQLLIAQMLSEDSDSWGGANEGGGGGGGATAVASNGNIFDVDTSVSGPGADSFESPLNFLNWNGLASTDIKTLLEGSFVLNTLFFKININAGMLLPVIDYFANVRKLQPFNIFAVKPVTLFSMSGGD